MDPVIRCTTLPSHSRSLKGFLFHFSRRSIHFYRLSHSELDDIEKVAVRSSLRLPKTKNALLMGFNPLVHSFCALSTLRRSGLRTASAAAKPCQGDSLEFYLITGSIYTDKRGTVVLATLFNESVKFGTYKVPPVSTVKFTLVLLGWNCYLLKESAEKRKDKGKGYFEKIWDFNQKFVPMDAEKASKKQKSPENERSSEKIVEEEVVPQKEREEVVKEPATRE
ncbi:hypothetical protein Tco_1018618 [Tanacetum coccineum]|uniref:Uncharacterized protein n=1 Tax=Tanacetum coccineum TaxID=301880 RepID=A0ABQ5FUV6_9ASTR